MMPRSPNPKWKLAKNQNKPFLKEIKEGNTHVGDHHGLFNGGQSGVEL